MSADTTLRLAKATDKIVAIKEACGNIEQMQAILDGRPDNFLVLSGDDGITVELVKRGGEGVISVAANAFPEKFCRCVDNAMAGNIAQAEGEMAELTEPINLLFREGNPTGVKGMCASMGVTKAEVRQPLVEYSDELKRDIEKAISTYDLK
jgi:4-hydroxy-tetrahydrodipicolinate synthase